MSISVFVRSLSPVVFAALLVACGPRVVGLSDQDAGDGNTGYDASNNSGQDASHNNTDGGGQANTDGSTSNLPDAGAAPDVTAEDDSYLVSDSNGSAATIQSGNMPAGDPRSPVYIDPFDGNTTFVRGGTNTFVGQIQGGAAMGLVVGFEELSGYFQVLSGSTDFSFFVTIGQSISRSSLTMVVIPILPVGEGSQGGYGRPLRVPCNVLQDVGGGDLQVSLSWNTDTDVDLHLVEPSGEEIYYGHKTSAAGGVLDLDSNAGCNIDSIDNENITYENVTPPSGHYITRVDYWDNCDVSEQISYTLTINIRGTPQVHQGNLTTAQVTGGGAGDGVTVAEFNF